MALVKVVRHVIALIGRRKDRLTDESEDRWPKDLTQNQAFGGLIWTDMGQPGPYIRQNNRQRPRIGSDLSD